MTIKPRRKCWVNFLVRRCCAYPARGNDDDLMAFERRSKAKEAARHYGVFVSDGLIIGSGGVSPLRSGPNGRRGTAGNDRLTAPSAFADRRPGAAAPARLNIAHAFRDDSQIVFIRRHELRRFITGIFGEKAAKRRLRRQPCRQSLHWTQILPPRRHIRRTQHAQIEAPDDDKN